MLDFNGVAKDVYEFRHVAVLVNSLKGEHFLHCSQYCKKYRTWESLLKSILMVNGQNFKSTHMYNHIVTIFRFSLLTLMSEEENTNFRDNSTFDASSRL